MSTTKTAQDFRQVVRRMFDQVKAQALVKLKAFDPMIEKFENLAEHPELTISQKRTIHGMADERISQAQLIAGRDTAKIIDMYAPTIKKNEYLLPKNKYLYDTVDTNREMVRKLLSFDDLYSQLAKIFYLGHVTIDERIILGSILDERERTLMGVYYEEAIKTGVQITDIPVKQFNFGN